jgi:hypothetical protein
MADLRLISSSCQAGLAAHAAHRCKRRANKQCLSDFVSEMLMFL